MFVMEYGSYYVFMIGLYGGVERWGTNIMP